ncbi:two-component system sensor histidine kinase YesM [Paenibacillus castaneae]|uniref:cache domain-containing sensor histidine kinase n=1 Tax=Paenibacillus castaneae TaxID=474957 RepID=UPI000C9C7BE0|nr:sensor histidine kinase [Paenibacillus castaneae]NIK80232.1 two-component system sensor histidine kinase YesM [Paenibacillus castaneae]
MSLKKRSQRIWAAIGGMRMERKLFLVFLLLITLPLSFIGYISYSNYSRSIEEKTIVYSTKMLENMMVRVDDYIEDMSRISSIPAYQDDIKQNLIQSNSYYEKRQSAAGENSNQMPDDFNLLLKIQRGIEGNISFINAIKRGANSVYIFDQYGNGYYSTTGGGIRLNVKESYENWLEQIKSSGGEAKLFSTEKYTSNLQSERYVFTIVRKVIDKQLKPIGMIAVDANISVIEDQMSELDKVTSGKSVIIDELGNVIYDSDKERMGTNIEDDPSVVQATGTKGSFYLESDGYNRLYIYTTSPNTNWKVITSIPDSELTKDAVVIRNVTWIATIITIIVALFISFVFSFALTNPLRKMMRLMKNVQEGDFNVQFQVKHRDEVGQLGNQFNRMIVRIDHLIQDIYVMETKKKEAELQALQSQINPHFMYNTLESIRMAAELNDDHIAADMIAILGKLLRYSISDLHEEVTLENEVGHMHNYVEMLNYRYPNRFRLETDISEELRSYPIIKLVLQPIVENAIYHGMDDNKPFMRIELIGECTQHILLLRIKDDGVGMDMATLDRLNRSLAGIEIEDTGEKQKTGGIGLKNVNERIKLHYGNAYGLKVKSKPNEGTEVILQLPLEARRDAE